MVTTLPNTRRHTLKTTIHLHPSKYDEIVPEDDPIARVKQHWNVPLTPYPYQEDVIRSVINYKNVGLWLECGTGKTLVATWLILNHLMKGKYIGQQARAVVLMPPILLDQWYAFLKKIPNLSVLLYRGTPKKRAEMKPNDFQVTLVSYDIYRTEFQRIVYDHNEVMPQFNTLLVCDEATALGNFSSMIYKRVRLMTDYYRESDNAGIVLLSGTPISNPLNGYTMTQLLDSKCYRSLTDFGNQHVTCVDDYGKPVSWQNLELLKDNMLLNAVRVVRREVREGLPEVNYLDIPYTLHAEHLKLYKKLALERVLELERASGKIVIDALEQSAIYNQLQQLVLNWGHFSEDESKVGAGFDLACQVLDELGDKKLVVVANYRMTIATLLTKLKPYGAVAINGESSDKDKEEAKRRFIQDPTCRVCILNPRSGGYGIDGFQKVCSDMLFVELPIVPKDFTQTVGRLDRDGQQDTVNVRLATALQTIQTTLRQKLLRKDEIVNRVITSWSDLRDELELK